MAYDSVLKYKKNALGALCFLHICSGGNTDRNLRALLEQAGHDQAAFDRKINRTIRELEGMLERKYSAKLEDRLFDETDAEFGSAAADAVRKVFDRIRQRRQENGAEEGGLFGRIIDMFRGRQ